jgi:hypothetical protein
MDQIFNFQKLAEKWPSAIVARTDVERFTGGLLSGRYLANLDCKGLGPHKKIQIGGKVAYDLDDFIQWLENRAKAA